MLKFLGFLGLVLSAIILGCYYFLRDKHKFSPDLQPAVLHMRWSDTLLRFKWGQMFTQAQLAKFKGTKIKTVINEEYFIDDLDGGEIRLRVFRPHNQNSDLPLLFYVHSGGYMIGLPEVALDFIKDVMKLRSCVVVAPAYRLSIKNPYPAGFDDCYNTLLWLKTQAPKLQIDMNKIILAGHSGGGGMVAALSLKARDTGDFKIAFQMPIYPMLDYRQNTPSARDFKHSPAWNSYLNRIAWRYYLRQVESSVPVYASPALATDYHNLPPTISFVGDMEPFRDEVITYIDNLRQAGVPVRFRLFAEAFHAFEVILPDTDLAKEANQFQLRAWADFYDLYVVDKG